MAGDLSKKPTNKGTHSPSSAEQGAHQDSEGKREGEGHSQMWRAVAVRPLRVEDWRWADQHQQEIRQDRERKSVSEWHLLSLSSAERGSHRVKAVAGLGTLALSDGVWADPQRRLSVQ